MKSVPTRIVLILFVFSLFNFGLVFAEKRTFIKEYTYQASEDDSRNSSRVIALREVKRLLLEELGTYLESETEVKNFQLSKDQITTLTAGIVQTEIIEEKWDGRFYRLKSKIVADEDKVVQSINELRKDRDKTKELEATRQRSDELLREVERLRKQMTQANNGNRAAQKAAYDKSIKELSAAEWIEKGQAANDFEEAVKAYSRAIELDPNNIEAYYFRARASEQNSAMSDYYKLLTIEPKNSESHLIRAWTYKELEKRDLALQEFEKAIDKASGNKEKATAYYDRGRFYLLFRPRPYATPSSRDIPGAMELSVRDFSSAIALDSTDPSYFHSRAGCYLALDKEELAIEDLNAGIRLDPKNAGLYSLRGQTYQFLEKQELAVADLSRAIELEGPDNLFVSGDYLLRVFGYEKLGKYELAIMDLNKLLEKKPDGLFEIKKRAKLYSKLGKYDQAIQDYSKSIALKPAEAASAYYDRALAYAAKGDSRRAIHDLGSAFQLDPGSKAKAQSDKGFGSLRNHPDFIKLTGQ